jgi:hypothetical protein
MNVCEPLLYRKVVETSRSLYERFMIWRLLFLYAALRDDISYAFLHHLPPYLSKHTVSTTDNKLRNRTLLTFFVCGNRQFNVFTGLTVLFPASP